MEFFEKYYTYALKFLSYRPRSEKEIRDALLKRKASPEVIEKIIGLLQEQRFLNDDDFTKWWIGQRTSFKPRSKRVIKLELQQKGIANDLIQKYVVEDEETAVNDLEQALRLSQKAMKKYRHAEHDEIYQKIGGMLARKGFTWDTIKRAIDLNLTSDSENF